MDTCEKLIKEANLFRIELEKYIQRINEITKENNSDNIFQSINEYKKTRRESLLRLRKKMMYQRDYIHSFTKRRCEKCNYFVNKKFCSNSWWFKNETISNNFEVEKDFYCKHYEE